MTRICEWYILYIIIFLLLDLISMFHQTCYQANTIVTFNAGMFVINGTFQKCTYSLFFIKKYCIKPEINMTFKANLNQIHWLLCIVMAQWSLDWTPTCLYGPRPVFVVAEKHLKHMPFLKECVLWRWKWCSYVQIGLYSSCPLSHIGWDFGLISSFQHQYVLINTMFSFSFCNMSAIILLQIFQNVLVTTCLNREGSLYIRSF